MAHKAADLAALNADLDTLSSVSREDLHHRWTELYRTNPPSRISRQFLLRAIAYRLQEKALGSLKPSVRRILDKAAIDCAYGKEIAVSAPAFKSGTRLLREWRGKTHEVTILDEGVLYHGARFRSLSEVARAITGTRWSGPRFFGLNRRSDVDATR